MRTFTLSDGAASELWKALNDSTGAPPQPQPAPQPIPAAAPPTSELDMIIAGAEYAPPPGGWPQRDPDQSPGSHNDTDYIHTNSKGGGYYTFPGYAERVAKPLGPIAKVDPYNPPGLYAVLSGIMLDQGKRDKLGAKLEVNGPLARAQIVNANFHADPDFEGALQAVIVNGSTPENVFAFYQASPVVKKPLGFTISDLQRGKDTADAL